MNRHQLETISQFSAGVVAETDDWWLVRVHGNIDMYVRKDDESVTPSLKNHCYWESWNTAWLIDNIPTSATFIDIGANTGFFGFVAGSKCQRVIAFEPNPNYADMIAESSKVNRIHVEVLSVALSNEKGLAELVVPNQLQGSASIVPGFDETFYPSEHMLVQTARLDDFHFDTFAAQGPLWIKIDAEGAEELIWQGAHDTLEIYRPTVMLEYTPVAYSDEFITDLYRYSGGIKWINFDGQLEPVDREWIERQTDWATLVV